MPKIVNMEGLKFGMLTVIGRAGVNSDGRVTWLCQCDCGNEKVVSGKAMRGGETSSCGCLRWGDKRKNDMKITKADIEAVVTYNPETGDLIWKERTKQQMSGDHLRREWNRQNAGKRAGFAESNGGHIRVTVKGSSLQARRVIWILMTGENPKGRLAHKDGNKSNLTWANIVSEREEKAKAKALAKLPASHEPKPVYPGVVYDSYIGKWRSFINLSKFVMVNLGSFATDDEAIKARADLIESMGVVV